MQEQQKPKLLIFQKQAWQVEQKTQQLQQQFEAEFEANQAQATQVQSFEQQARQVSGLDQKPKVVQVDLITTHLATKSVEFEMDPTPCSFQGMDP